MARKGRKGSKRKRGTSSRPRVSGSLGLTRGLWKSRRRRKR